MTLFFHCFIFTAEKCSSNYSMGREHPLNEDISMHSQGSNIIHQLNSLYFRDGKERGFITVTNRVVLGQCKQLDFMTLPSDRHQLVN